MSQIGRYSSISGPNQSRLGGDSLILPTRGLAARPGRRAGIAAPGVGAEQNAWRGAAGAIFSVGLCIGWRRDLGFCGVALRHGYWRDENAVDPSE